MADTIWGPQTDDTTWPQPTCAAYRWCTEDPGHVGRHRRDLAEIRPEKLEMDASVSISVEAMGGDAPYVVLSLGFTGKPRFCAARLTWSQTERVSRALGQAKRRYGAG